MSYNDDSNVSYLGPCVCVEPAGRADRTVQTGYGGGDNTDSYGSGTRTTRSGGDGYGNESYGSGNTGSDSYGSKRDNDSYGSGTGGNDSYGCMCDSRFFCS